MADVNFFDNFETQWAQNGSTEAISEDQYKLGWAFIGSTPPSVEQFNEVQQLTDQKAAWLFSQLKAVADEQGVQLTQADRKGLLKVLDKYAGKTLSFGPNIPIGADLNTYVTRGIYRQTSTVNAAAGSNYPTAQAGFLIVYDTGISTDAVSQFYHAANSNRLFYRTLGQSTWWPWVEVATTDTIGSLAGQSTLTADAGLDASWAGKLVNLSGSTTYTVTLPAASTMPSGRRIVLKGNNTAGVTVALHGADTADWVIQGITWPISLRRGESIELVSRGTGGWYVLRYDTLNSLALTGAPTAPTPALSDNSTKLSTTAFVKAVAAALAGSSNQQFAVAAATLAQHAVNLGQFATVLGYSGSIRIPVSVGGVSRTLIANWGTFAGSLAGDTPITFSTAFPNQFLIALVSGQCVGTGAWGGYNSATLAGMNGNWWSAAGTRQSGNATYIALGW